MVEKWFKVKLELNNLELNCHTETQSAERWQPVVDVNVKNGNVDDGIVPEDSVSVKEQLEIEMKIAANTAKLAVLQERSSMLSKNSSITSKHLGAKSQQSDGMNSHFHHQSKCLSQPLAICSISRHLCQCSIHFWNSSHLSLHKALLLNLLHYLLAWGLRPSRVWVVLLWIYLLSFSFSAFSLLASCAFSAIQRETSSWLSSVVFLSFSSREEKAICRASYSSFSVWFALSRSCRRQRGRNLKVGLTLYWHTGWFIFSQRSQIENLRSDPFLVWRYIILGSVRCF